MERNIFYNFRFVDTFGPVDDWLKRFLEKRLTLYGIEVRHTVKKLKMKKTTFGSLILLLAAMGNTVLAQSKSSYAINFDPAHFHEQTLTLNGKAYKVKAFENIVYIQHLVDTA